MKINICPSFLQVRSYNPHLIHPPCFRWGSGGSGRIDAGSTLLGIMSPCSKACTRAWDHHLMRSSRLQIYTFISKLVVLSILQCLIALQCRPLEFVVHENIILKRAEDVWILSLCLTYHSFTHRGCLGVLRKRFGIMPYGLGRFLTALILHFEGVTYPMYRDVRHTWIWSNVTMEAVYLADETDKIIPEDICLP